MFGTEVPSPVTREICDSDCLGTLVSDTLLKVRDGIYLSAEHDQMVQEDLAQGHYKAPQFGAASC